jgi:hypothetical protein
MAPKKCLHLLSLSVIGGLTGCSTAVQWNRDKLHYSTFARGTEVYSTGDLNSIDARMLAATTNLDFYRQYRQVLAEYDPATASALAEAQKVRVGAQDGGDKGGGSTTVLQNRVGILERKIADQQKVLSVAGRKKNPGNSVHGAKKLPDNVFVLPTPFLDTGEAEPGSGLRVENIPPPSTPAVPGGKNPQNSVAQAFWPLKSIQDLNETTQMEFANEKPVKSTVTKPNEAAVQALSSMASMAQMRDLLTEPSFPQMVPVSRHITLGCVPPTDNIVFNSMDALKAAATASDNNQAIKNIVAENGGSDEQQQSRNRQLEANLALTSQTLAVKAVQETQKTWFLQWALFRLCEAGLNSTEVRNTVPVVIHDIVRRTAEMSDSVEAEITKRISAEEDTRRAEIEKAKAIELEVQKRETAVATADLQQKVIDSQSSLAQQQTELQKLNLQLEERKRVNLCMDMTRKEKQNITFAELRKACE